MDGARGVAAATVMVYHIAAAFGWPSVIPGSFLAVDMFFLMSGFVVAFSYEKRLRSGAMSFGRFVKVRAIRLAPLYFAACGLGMLFFLGKIAVGQPDAPAILEVATATGLNLLFLPAPPIESLGSGMFPFAPAAWSLAFEMWGCVAYALIIPRLGTRGVAALSLTGLVALAILAFGFGTTDMGWGLGNLWGGGARFVFSFLLGVILFRTAGHLSGEKGWYWAACAAVLLFIFTPHNAVAPQLFWIMAAFPLFIVLALQLRPEGLLATLCEHLGRQSYALYILHTPIIMLTSGTAQFLAPDIAANSPWMLGIAALAGVLIASAVLTYAFDEPVRRWLRKL
jgi:peptidoglycan/LPS O-acetylase OafA/YrhL